MPNAYPVTLCALSSQYLHVTPAPYALLAGVRTFCTQSVDCQVVQGTVNEPVEAVADRIAATSPRLVGLSCYIWNISRVKELLPLLRQRLPDAYILLGGPEVTSHSAARLAASSAVRASGPLPHSVMPWQQRNPPQTLTV